MKKIVLAAVMLLSSVSMFAQHEVGSLTIQPKVGLNISNVTKTNGDPRIGVAVGAEAEYQLGDIYSIAVGLLYSSQGNKQTVDLVPLGTTSVTWAPSYLNIPVVANVYVVKNLAVKLGVQPGFCIAKDKAEVYNMLKAGSKKAESVAAATLDEVKDAMGINYFKK